MTNPAAREPRFRNRLRGAKGATQLQFSRGVHNCALFQRNEGVTVPAGIGVDHEAEWTPLIESPSATGGFLCS